MPNNELDYQVLLGTYQRKSADLLAQVIALEARVGQNNNTIEALSNFLKDINKHDVKLVGIKSLIKKRTIKNSLITKNANLVFP